MNPAQELAAAARAYIDWQETPPGHDLGRDLSLGRARLARLKQAANAFSLDPEHDRREAEARVLGSAPATAPTERVAS